MTALTAAPTPAAAAGLTPSRVTALLRRAGRRNDAGLASRISAQLRAQTLRQPAGVEHALGVTAGLLGVITAMSTAITALEDQLATVFARRRQAEIIGSLPGLGPVLDARVLGELGDC